MCPMETTLRPAKIKICNMSGTDHSKASNAAASLSHRTRQRYRIKDLVPMSKELPSVMFGNNQQYCQRVTQA